MALLDMNPIRIHKTSIRALLLTISFIQTLFVTCILEYEGQTLIYLMCNLLFLHILTKENKGIILIKLSKINNHETFLYGDDFRFREKTYVNLRGLISLK